MADANTIRWDSVGAEKVKRDYADILGTNEKTAIAFLRTGDAATKAGAGVERLGVFSREYASHAKVASASTDALNVGLASLARYASGAALVDLARRAILAADSFKTLQNQLRVAGFENDALAAATGRLFQISNRTQTSIEANATLYGRLASVQKELGASTEQLFTFTEAVGNALKINNTEAGAAQGALLQLSQAMGGATIQAQEFNSLIDGARPLLQAAARHIDGAGGSVSKLQQMVRDGELSNRAFFDGILQGSQELEEQAGRAQTNISQSLVVLRNRYIEAAGGSEALTGAANLSATAITGLAGAMSGLFDKIDKDMEPLLAVGGALTDIIKYSTELAGTATPQVKGFFDIALDAAQSALNPIGAFARHVGVLGDFLDKYGSFGPGKVGSVGWQPGVTDLSGLPVNSDFDPMSGYRQEQAAGAGRKNPYGAIAFDAEIAKAVKAQEDWQDRVADGWRGLYDKVGEASADFNRQIGEDARKAGDDLEKGIQDRKATIDGVISDLLLETQLLGLSNQERERRLGLMRLEAVNASPDDIARYNSASDANQASQIAQKEADEVNEIWDKARDDFRSGWREMFADLFDGGKFRFKDFTDSMRSMWGGLLADLVMQSAQSSFIDPLFEALTGKARVGGASGGTGVAGTLDIFKMFTGGGSSSKSSQWAGAFDGADSSVSDSMGGLAGGGMMGAVGGALGGAAMGGGIGKMLGSGTGGSIGGAIASAFGPIGSLVGSLIGGLFGGLMKSTPKSISSYGADGVIDSMASGGLDVKIGKDMASAVVRALRTFSEQLVTGLDGDAFFGIVGQRGKKFFYQAQETDLKVAGKKKYGAEKFDSAEEAISAAIEAAINSGVIKGLTDADKKLMRAATSVEQAMSDVVSSHNFKRELDFQFTGLSSPFAEAQARLEFEYQQQLILAEKYEADKTQLEAVYAAKRAALQKDYQEQMYGGLKDYLTALTGGSASPLSPTSKLNLAQARYNELAGKARGGDRDAIGALQGAAQDYLGAGSEVFASSGGYFSIYNRVVGDISGITGVANPLGVGTAANSNVAAAMNDNSRMQAAAFNQAASQRNTTNQQLAEIKALLVPVAGALQRGAVGPTQNGVVQVGWPNLAVNW